MKLWNYRVCGVIWQIIPYINYAHRFKGSSGLRKKYEKNRKNRSKTIDKYAVAKYNIYIIKQNKLIKSNGKEGKPFGKTEKERQEKRTARTEANQIPNL